MDFQAEVGTWMAAHILARLPIGSRFGLSATLVPESIRLETGEGLDDTLVSLKDGSQIDLQCKTRAGLSQDADSPLGKTVAQLVRMVIAERVAGRDIDLSKTRAVLAVSTAAPRSLDALERGCRAFDLGGDWETTKAQRSQEEREALELFEAQARTAWSGATTEPVAATDLVVLARVFRIVRFSMNEGDDNWREASCALGGRVYGSEAAGEAPLRELKAIVRDLIGSGAPADREGLLRVLRVRGHGDVRSPDFDADLVRLAETTGAELDRLAGHTRLPIAGGIPIARQSDRPLAAAITSGSLIVIGEPGAGKTGALVAFARDRRAAGDAVVFLSVDRFPGAAIASDLQSELRLSHPLIDVLAAAPGVSHKFLIIDALDAARGGPAQGVFAQLIEAVCTALATDWTVVASVRTFDLKNGRRYRDTIPGSPPDLTFADMSLRAVRHFRVPRLNEDDLANAGTQAPALGALLAAAPGKLRDLLGNVFNLSLAAQLLADGASPDSIRNVSTQSDLIDAYEDRRLDGTALQRGAAATANAMVHRRRLAVRKVAVAHDRLDDVIQSGVLTEAGDLVSFSHHVLFDHVIGRFLLDWHHPPTLIGQLVGDSAVALMLAPGLRFAVERLWRSDGDGKPQLWRLVADIYADVSVDPVLANVALRTAIECVSDVADITGLTHLIDQRATEETLAVLLSRLARFIGLAVDAEGGLEPQDALAWAMVAEAVTNTGQRGLSDAARFLLYTLFEKADLAAPPLLAVFGRAARALLALAWDSIPPMPLMATNAIRFVGKSFASDPGASRALLDRALRDPHFSAHADKEATWIAEQILPIARSDLAFAIEIFRVLYSREITDSSTSYFGGRPSRIMALSSNRRQDYEQSRYQLGRQAGDMLELSAYAGTRAVIESALGSADRDGTDAKDRERVALPGRVAFTLIGREYGFNSWDDPDEHDGAREADVLTHYIDFLRTCTVQAFAESIEAAASGYSSPAVWARLLGIGAERVAELMELLWPFARNVTMLTHPDTVRDAVRFLAAGYPLQTVEARTAFEIDALRPGLFVGESEQHWWRRALARLLSLVDEAELATGAMCTLRDDLAAEGELRGNPPLSSMKMGWVPAGSVTRSLLAREGVNVDEGIDARMLAQSETLYDQVQQTPKDSPAALAALWGEVEATIALFDAHASELHDSVEQPVWGHISNAVERIAGTAAYFPGVAGLPTLEALLVVLRRLWTSRFPEPKANDGGRLSWGNWEVRVYAADAYVSLVDRFGTDYPEIVEKVDAILVDPAPAARLQAAQNLQVLHRVAPDRMWALADQIARIEPHDEVLGAFLDNVVSRLRWQDVERCEAMIEAVVARRPIDRRDRAEGRDSVATPVGGLAAHLWVGQDRSKALCWATAWAAEPTAYRDFLTSFLATLRAAFFARYASGDDFKPHIADRAQQAAMTILEACSEIAARSHRAVVVDGVEDVEREAAVATYEAAERVIGQLMNQLYFGSGAYADTKQKPVGLTNVAAMRRFLDDYRPMLERLAKSHEPSTHHHLVELYEYLIPGDPEGAFDALHALLLGAGAREGYHHEGLASTVIVRMVTRYLADHRSIFEDDARRARLVEILRLFSDAGWPDALKLLYDLPELLR